ncbi:uncharacterized protein [Diadema antillarum]|uniref:uncharacterized protein n=1 Tax=Diadema antillarum TaxID=105358 RepID=UPI003A8665ED
MATSVNDLVTCNLQCPICINVFVDPRLLSCSHTYCKDCLMRLSNSQKGRKIICPVCRKVTNVPKGNVDLLQSNQPIKSLIEDVKNQTQACTVCRGNEKPLAITYCQECDDYMCVDCHKTHDRWDKFAGHEVVKVDDINSGKVSKKKRRKCQKHKSEDEECFCVECKRFVCFRCGMMEHGKKGHNVLDGKEHEDEQKEKIGELRGRADVEKSKIDEYIVFIEEQQAKMQQVLDKLSREIEQTCEESIQQLQERRDHLIKECTRRIEVFNKELQGMKDASKLQISQMKEVSDLVENGLKMPLEGEALTAHDTLCQNLEEILGMSKRDYEQPRKTTWRGERVAFQRIRRRARGLNELDLGEVVIANWVLDQVVPFPTKDGINCIASSPNGQVAAGSRFGGLFLYDVEGKQQVVLKDVGIRGVAFLSDGRVAVRDSHNHISIYTKSFVNQGIQSEFITPSHDEGGFGGFAVDYEDSALIASFTKLKKIFVYPIRGGKPAKKISCDFKPIEVFGLRSSVILVVTEENLGILDSTGNFKKGLTRKGYRPQPAVCLDGTIAVAWVKHDEGLLMIEQYSRNLEPLRTLVADFKFQIPQHSWYHLREFSTGELAFCTPDNLYIFRKTSSVS